MIRGESSYGFPFHDRTSQRERGRKGTLEEKILRRQALKKALSASIVTHDIAGVKNLTRDELLNLFTLSEPVEQGA